MLGEYLKQKYDEGYVIDYIYHPKEMVLEAFIRKDNKEVKHLLDHTYLHDEERFVNKLIEMVKELDNERNS